MTARILSPRVAWNNFLWQIAGYAGLAQEQHSTSHSSDSRGSDTQMGCTTSQSAAPAPATAYASGGGVNFEETAPEPSGPDLRPDAPFVWYWEEDAQRLDTHHTWDKQGNFIAYPPKVSTYLEERHAAGGNADDLEITYFSGVFKS